MTTTTKPRVSIGVPVYNGADFLAEALESLLAQTYAELEIIISDNGSTDATELICRQFVARDARVHYHRSPTNRGAAWNYNRTFALATGKYFKWQAHDDALTLDYIEKCVAVLEQHPQVVLCYTWVRDIDEGGRELCIKQSSTNADHQQAHMRFRGLSRVKAANKCEEVFGLMRTDVLRKTKLIDNYTDSDRTLLADLGLHGPFYEIPEPLFLHRMHQKSSVIANPKRQERTAWFDPAAAGRIVFPNWRQLYELLWVIGHSPLPWSERVRCYGHMLAWVKRRRRRLSGDVVWALKRLVGNGMVRIGVAPQVKGNQ
jgi:glycosyltransferase involved in cell wall biosynthesis